MREIKIVSGGQTGVDRAALDAALESGVSCGGWCPADRRDEVGTIPQFYPVKPLPEGGYRARTRRNIQDSDGTVVIYFDEPSGGTAQTIRFAVELEKPFKLLDLDELSVERSVELLDAFVERHQIRTLNVAGPRASNDPRAYSCTYQLILNLLQRYQTSSP